MERRNLFNLLVGSLLLVGPFLSSCSKDDLKEASSSGNRMLTFNVGVGFEDNSDEQSRAFMEEADTIYQNLGDGMKIEAIIEGNKFENSRAKETMANGVAVLAIVYNTTTNRVHSVQNLVIYSGKLICQVPDDRNVRVVFYSYNTTTPPTTSLVVNDPITKFDEANSAVSFREDVLRVESIDITPDTNITSLGSIVFKHMFTRIKTIMTGRKKFTHFIAMMDDESARRDAAVNIVLGTMTPGVEPVGTLMHGYETGTKVVSSDFEYFIPTAIESHTLSLTQVDHKAVVYPPVTFNKRFEAGHSYTIYVSLLN